MTRRAAVLAAAIYTAITIGMTWPLALVADKEIAWDLGDPVFNSWVLLWTGGQVLAFLGGDFSALGRYWHGNIFYPERLTVAYSEHIAPQMLQGLPILAATDNIVLTYNLLFLSTFVLSGLGAFLLVRELTRSPLAAFVAGLAFAFAPYRLAQMSHLQVLSAQWMPFVLYGFRRYFETGRRAPLIGGAAALVAQNLSCGYYLLFFGPFAGLYVVYEIASRRLWGDWRVWRTWIATGAVVGVCTWPFLSPYLEVRKGGEIGVRDAGEIAMFSADTHAFATAPGWSRLWGERMTGLLRPEGEGFPGLVIIALALVGLGWGLRTAISRARETHGGPGPPWREFATGVLVVLWLAHLYGAISFLVTGVLAVPIDGAWAAYRQASGTFMRTLALSLALVAVSPWTRRVLRGAPRSALGYFAGAAVLAALLAMGPSISAAGQPISPGPYAWLVSFVPGFDGVRVPARYLMLVALFLAVLAGYGAAALLRWWPRAAVVALAVLSCGLLTEWWPGRFPTNVRLAAEGLEVTPRTLYTGDRLPPLYKVIRDGAEPVVLVEFPFGSHAWDLQSVFYAGYHRRPLVNGYSGFFPESWQTLTYAFSLIPTDSDAPWRALVGTRATHVLVHEAAYPASRQHQVTDWLRTHGAIEILSDGTDKLFTLR
jgi:hypothetical protein